MSALYLVDGKPVDLATYVKAYVDRGGPARLEAALAIGEAREAREAREAQRKPA